MYGAAKLGKKKTPVAGDCERRRAIRRAKKEEDLHKRRIVRGARSKGTSKNRMTARVGNRAAVAGNKESRARNANWGKISGTSANIVVERKKKSIRGYCMPAQHKSRMRCPRTDTEEKKDLNNRDVMRGEKGG